MENNLKEGQFLKDLHESAIAEESKGADSLMPTAEEIELIRRARAEANGFADNAKNEGAQVLETEGSALIIENKVDPNPNGGIVAGGLPQSVLAGAEKWLSEANADIDIAGEQDPELLKAIQENFEDKMRAVANGEPINYSAPNISRAQEVTEDEEEEEIEEEYEFDKDKYDKAIVYIDKIGMGTVKFSDDEKAKMEKAKVIRVEEVEVIDLETIRVKRPKKSDVNKIISRINTTDTTALVLPASGYTVSVGKCSLLELTNLFVNKENMLETYLTKWNFIFDKIVTSSVPLHSFNDFLEKTAISDYSTLVFGILCASYPEEDSIGLKCTSEKCPGTVKNRKKSTDYEYTYGVRSMIRAERMSEELLNKVATIVDSSYIQEDAIKVHEESPVTLCKRVRLPLSGHIFECGIQSAHDFIYNSAKASEDIDEKYGQALTTATMVRKVFMLDEEDGEYVEVVDKKDVAKIIYTLSDVDLKMLVKISNEQGTDLAIEYGFQGVTCPYCGAVTPFIDIDPDEILFHRYRQAASIE